MDYNFGAKLLFPVSPRGWSGCLFSSFLFGCCCYCFSFGVAVATCYGDYFGRDVSLWPFTSYRSLPASLIQSWARSSHVQTSMASSRGKAYEGTSQRLRRSQSPSRTYSRGGSASPGGGKHNFRSRSPSQSRKADEDHQEEQSSIDFISGCSASLFGSVTKGPVRGLQDPWLYGSIGVR